MHIAFVKVTAGNHFSDRLLINFDNYLKQCGIFKYVKLHCILRKIRGIKLTFWEQWDYSWRQLDTANQVTVSIIVVWVLLGILILTIDAFQDAFGMFDISF